MWHWKLKLIGFVMNLLDISVQIKCLGWVLLLHTLSLVYAENHPIYSRAWRLNDDASHLRPRVSRFEWLTLEKIPPIKTLRIGMSLGTAERNKKYRNGWVPIYIFCHFAAKNLDIKSLAAQLLFFKKWSWTFKKSSRSFLFDQSTFATWESLFENPVRKLSE